MPGVPPSGSSEAIHFWISFWSQLYSGFLSSILTGFIVGLVVWWVQLRAEQRRTRNDAARELALFREKLRNAVEEPDILNFQTATDSIPPAARAIHSVVSNHPVDYWYSVLKRHRAFLDEVKRFQHAHTAFGKAAQRLDVALRQVIRLHNAARGAIAVNDPYDHAYFLGRLHGMSDEEILPWIDLPSKTHSSRFESSFSAAMADEEVASRVDEYQRRREELVSHIEKLETLLKTAH